MRERRQVQREAVNCYFALYSVYYASHITLEHVFLLHGDETTVIAVWTSVG